MSSGTIVHFRNDLQVSYILHQNYLGEEEREKNIKQLSQCQIDL